MREDFRRLFTSVFVNPDMMISLVKAIGSKHYGLTRSELAKLSGISEGGTLSKALSTLVASDFIIKYIPFGINKREEHYKLIDPFCNFYLRFVENETEIRNDFWLSNIESQSIVT